MSVAGDFRDTLMEVLQPLLRSSGFVETGFELVPGRLEGPLVDKDRGSVWVENIVEDDDQKTLENIDARLRVFKRFDAGRGADMTPFDPTVLEEVGEYVQTSLNTRHVQLGPWSARVIEQDFLIEEQGIEISILGVHGNLAIRSFS